MDVTYFFILLCVINHHIHGFSHKEARRWQQARRSADRQIVVNEHVAVGGGDEPKSLPPWAAHAPSTWRWSVARLARSTAPGLDAPGGPGSAGVCAPSIGRWPSGCSNPEP